MPSNRNPKKDPTNTGRKAIPGDATASDSGTPSGSTPQVSRPAGRRPSAPTSRHLSLTDARDFRMSPKLAARVEALAEDPLVRIGQHDGTEFKACVHDGVEELEAMFPNSRWAYKRKRSFVRDMILDRCHPDYSTRRREVDSSLDMVELRPDDEDPATVFAAIMRRPAMIWLYLWLQLCIKGRPGFRNLMAGSLLVTGLGRQRPHITEGRKTLLANIGRSAYDLALGFPVHKSQAAAEEEAAEHAGRELEEGHIVGEPEGSTYSSMTRAMKRVFRRRNPEVLKHINAEAFQELAVYCDEGRADSHAKFGQICAIDAQILDSDLSPKRYSSMERSAIDELWGKLVALIKYDNKKSRVGRKRVSIIDVPSRRTLVWTYIKATTPEHKAVETLMRQLFEVWPRCPIKVLIGDGAYETTDRVHRFLIFRCGVWPIFHRRKRPYAARTRDGQVKEFLVPLNVPVPVDYDKNGKPVTAQQQAPGAMPGLQGVPECPEHGLMTFHSTNGDELTPGDRIRMLDDAEEAQAKLDRAGELGLTDAEMDELKAQTKVSFPLAEEHGTTCTLRFKCDHCSNQASAKVRWDARIYSKYPRAGTGPWVNRRHAYINARSSIESMHAEAIWHGAAGLREACILKDTDEKVAWLDGLAILSMTLWPLVLLDGSYAAMERRLLRLGIRIGNRKDGRDILPPRSIDEQLRFDTRRELWEQADPPASWVADRKRREDATLEQGYSTESRVYSFADAKRARDARLAAEARQQAGGESGAQAA